MLNLPSSFQMVKNWLISSGINLAESSDKNNGAVHSFYDSKQNEYSFLYPEITGYFLSSLRFLYDVENNSDYLILAKNSGNWLCNLYEQNGGIIQGVMPGKSQIYDVYSFDTAICAKGLQDCFIITGEKKYLDYSTKMLDWIKKDVLNDNGTLKPLMNLESKKFEESNSAWYKKYGCYHIKTSIPFFQQYDISKNSEDLVVAKKICKNFEKFQKSNGSILLHQNENTIHLHSLCYALEGLIVAYGITGEKSYLLNCKKTLEWCSSQLEKDGSVNLWFNANYQKSKTSYHIAQLIRLMILVDKAENTSAFKKSIDDLHSFLLTLQSKDQGTKVNGGFYEEYYKGILGWKIRQRLSSWGSLFALQELYWYENYDKITFDDSITNLY